MVNKLPEKLLIKLNKQTKKRVRKFHRDIESTYIPSHRSMN